jgi:Bacterial aa3 type cytochrome c oxidase subunit IV
MGQGTSDQKGAAPMADHQQPEHKHGSMDIRAHEKTFAGFTRMTVWVVVIAICVLIFMGLVNA